MFLSLAMTLTGKKYKQALHRLVPQEINFNQFEKVREIVSIKPILWNRRREALGRSERVAAIRVMG